MENNITPFSLVYDSFTQKITDDMYIVLNKIDTDKLMEELLISAIPHFEFPRVNINDYTESYTGDETTYKGVESDYMEVSSFPLLGGCFNCVLSKEEINILATYMVVEWLGQQIASIENIRMKYTGTDFKMTSQANHLHKLMQLKEKYVNEGFHLQRLYKRRKLDENGIYRSTFGTIMDKE